MVNRAFLDLGEAGELQVFLENAAEPGPWEERVSPEIQDLRGALGTGVLVGRREMMGEMELAVKDAEARKEKEDSLDTQVRRAILVSQGQMDHQDPKASEAEGETQDLQGYLDRRETPVTQGHLVTKAAEATQWTNVRWSRASKINALAVTGPWSAPSSRRSWPSPWTPPRGSLRTRSAG